MCIIRGFILSRCVILLTTLAVDVTAAKADNIKVDDDGLDCPSAEYTTIQFAVDFAKLNGINKVTVCTGTYPEQVVIDGLPKFKLQANGVVVVQPPPARMAL
jgi:hypothetical protein